MPPPHNTAVINYRIVTVADMVLAAAAVMVDTTKKVEVERLWWWLCKIWKEEGEATTPSPASRFVCGEGGVLNAVRFSGCPRV